MDSEPLPPPEELLGLLQRAEPPEVRKAILARDEMLARLVPLLRSSYATIADLEAESTDRMAALRVMDTIDGVCAHMDRLGLRRDQLNVCLGTPLSSSVLAAISENQLGAKGVSSALLFKHIASLSSSFLRDGKGARMDGVRFFDDLLMHACFRSQTVPETDNVIDELFDLSRSLESRTGEESLGLPYLLHVLSGRDLARVRTILAAQAHGEPEQSKAFLRHCKNFLLMFGDVSEFLRTSEQHRSADIDTALVELEQMLCNDEIGQVSGRELQAIDSDQRHLSVKERALEMLRTVIHDERLVTQPMNDATPVNLYTVLAEKLSSVSVDENPWILRSLKDTPFDSAKLGALITTETPREAIAIALQGLNQYPMRDTQNTGRLLLEHLDLLIAARSAIESEDVKPDDCDEMLTQFAERGLLPTHVFFRMLQVRWKTMLLESHPVLSAKNSQSDRGLSLLQRLEQGGDSSAEQEVADFLVNTLHTSSGQAIQALSGSIQPEELLSIALHASEKWIAEEADHHLATLLSIDPDLLSAVSIEEKRKLLTLVTPLQDEDIHDPVGLSLAVDSDQYIVPSHILLRLLDVDRIALDGNAQQGFVSFIQSLEAGLKEYPITAQSPLLARSLYALLRTPQGSIELPLDRCKSHKRYYRRSQFDILARLAINTLDPETLKKGPCMQGAGSERLGEPILPSFDAENLHPDRQRLRQNFDTAKIGYRRRGLTERAVDLLGMQDNQYEWAMKFAERECALALNGPHQFAFRPSAHAAFQAFVLQAFPTLGPHDNIIITDQEYDVVTETVVRNTPEKGFAIPKVLHVSHPEGHQKTKEELVADALALIEPGTKMFIMSSLTRFGDIPCSEDGKGKDNLVWVLRQISNAHPQLTIVIDGCQGLGRIPLPVLKDLPKTCVYLGSGSKALSVGEVGFLAIHPEYTSVTGRRFVDKPSTLPLQNVVALSLALRRENAKYNLRRPEKNAEQIDGHPRRQKMHMANADRLSKLSRYVSGKVQAYGQEFLARSGVESNAHSSLANMDRSQLSEYFGCRVYAPHPDSKGERHYGGIITVFFPSVSAIELQSSLLEAGFEASYLRAGQQALRISLHHFHTEADIDALFQALQAAHHAVLPKLLLRSRLRSIESPDAVPPQKQLMTPPPSEPEEDMPVWML